MRVGQPSQTARGAAAYRAMHQTHESAAIFHDPFAERILDDETRATLDEHAANPSTRGMRLFIVSRSRFSEEALAACVGRGAGQVVVLGAGLDTFSLRNPFLHVRVFEVDFPATQAWKRQQLQSAGLAVPETLVFAPVDFERESLADGLARAGFRRDQPAFFQWLGVVPYLSSEAISSALDFIVSIPNAAVVFDYTEPFENHPPERRANLMATAERAASPGYRSSIRASLRLCCVVGASLTSKTSALPISSIVTRPNLPRACSQDRAATSSAQHVRPETACSKISSPSARNARANPPPW